MTPHKYSTFDLKAHLAQEHSRSPFSKFLKEIVYGGTDGIVTTFAVVAGFSGAQAGAEIMSIPIFVVLLFGFANLLADGASMGIGNFLGVQAGQDLYKKEEEKERLEVERNLELEKAETIAILTQKGFDEKDAIEITKLYAKNEPYWVEFMMRDELDMPNPKGESPLLTGIATAISFVCFGIIPLLPFLILPQMGSYFQMSIIFTMSALLLLGLLRYKVTGMTIVRSVGETIILGGISASIAYFVGSLFRI